MVLSLSTSKGKNEQSKTQEEQPQLTVDYTPQSFVSKNLKLLPPNLSKVVEFLLYYKPTYNKHNESSAGVSYISRRSLMPSKSTISYKRKFSTARMMGLDTQNILFKHQDEPIRTDSAPSLFRIRSDPWPEARITGDTFSVTILETETIVLLYIPSCAAIVGTERAASIKEVNDDYWTRMKNYRKMYDIQTQTITPLTCDRWIGMKKSSRRDSQTQVSYSEIWDTNNKIENEFRSQKSYTKSQTDDPRKVLIVNDLQDSKKKKLCDLDEDEFYEACKMVEVVQSEEFYQCAVTLFRNIDKNINRCKQITFLKGNPTDPFAQESNITYDIEHLWTLRYINVWGLPVTSICINPANPNIVAVGHGMYFKDQPQHLGRVCIWNFKNCSLPEKHFECRDGVSSVSFSRKHPFALLVSLISGSIMILDISKSKPEIVVSYDGQSSDEPIWQVRWFWFDSGLEEPVACGTKGHVYLFSKSNFTKKIFLSLSKREGTLKGLPHPKPCRKPVSITENPSVTCLATSPDNCHNYLVGTEDGCVHLCSTSFSHDHVDVFQAHIGPVHSIKHHPDCSNIFLTVGVDCFVRIWVLGVFEALFDLQDTEHPFEDADWSPVNPNIIATVASDRLSLWDISLVKLVPQRVIHSPTGSRFTSVSFTSKGFSLICSDIFGDIHIYSLSHMPLMYFNKSWALCSGIKRLVRGRKDLYDQLMNMGHPFDIDTSDI